MGLTLRGVVLSKFKSINEFSKVIGWGRGKAARIINGIQEPTSKEIEEIVQVLDMPLELFLHIFFAQSSTKWTNKNTSELLPM